MEIKGPVRTGGRWGHGKVRHILGRASISTPSGASGPSGLLSTVEPHGGQRSVAVNLEPDENNDAVREILH